MATSILRQTRLVRRTSPIARIAIRHYAIPPASTSPTGLPPSPPPAVSPAASQRIPTIVVSSSTTAAPIKPVVVIPAPADIPPPVSTLPPPSASLPPPPPPPPPPPKAPRRFFRRLLLYTSLSILVFYPTSALVSTRSDRYRDFFTSTFPFAEEIADYAEDHEWQKFGPMSVLTGAKAAQEKGQALVDRVKGNAAPVEEKVKVAAKQVKVDAKEKKDAAASTLKRKLSQAEIKAEELKSQASAKTAELSKSAGAKLDSLKSSASSTFSTAEHKASELAHTVAASTSELGHNIKAKTEDLIAAVPTIKFSDGVEEIVREAETVLGGLKQKVTGAEEAIKDAVRVEQPSPSVQSQLVDTMPARGVKAEKAPTGGENAGKLPYMGAPLPLGFEPPPGYYIPKAASKEASTTEEKKSLPLLAPEVKDFPSSKEEPIISQLASTIDSLASSLSSLGSADAPTLGAAPPAPSSILTRAKSDLSALSSRLESLKSEEKSKLQEVVERKKGEFEEVLRRKEDEWRGKEGELMEGWKGEREKLVEGWRGVLERELEGQRVGIEERLREEVIAQGIELQRRWLRSIKAQVESERGGRLSKLDSLSSSFKQLERITLDNSSQLDANVSLHTLWSALRAVQAKADKGGVRFDDELRVLKSAAAAAGQNDERGKVIQTVLESVEQSGAAAEGIKSFPSLSGWFTNSLAPKIQSVSLVPAEHEAGVLSHVASALLSKLLFTRKAGFVDGDDIGAILARAEWYLGEKDLDGATREVNQMSGWAGKLAGDWLREARKRLTVQQALEIVATEATLSSLLLV